MKKQPLIAVLAITSALLLGGASAHAQLLIGPGVNNGDFSGGLTNWADSFVNGTNTGTSTAAGRSDTGIAGSVSGGSITAGSQVFYAKGGDAGIFNLVSAGAFTLEQGDTLTLTFYAQGNSSSPTPPDLFATLFATSDGTYGGTGAYGTNDSNVLTLNSVNVTSLPINGSHSNGATYQEYTLTFTDSSALYNGDQVGVTFANSGTANYINLTDVTLTATAGSVPEPSSYALLFVGLGGLLLIRRLSRTLHCASTLNS